MPNIGYSTIITQHFNENEVKNLISQYKQNIENLSNKIKYYVKDNNDLNDYLDIVNYYYSKRYATILDRVNYDLSFQKQYEKELKKYLNFYNKVTINELDLIYSPNHSINSINILHSNNDKLFTKLSEFKNEYDNKFKDDDFNDKLYLNNFTITIPKDKKNETSRSNKFNFTHNNKL